MNATVRDSVASSASTFNFDENDRVGKMMMKDSEDMKVNKEGEKMDIMNGNNKGKNEPTIGSATIVPNNTIIVTTQQKIIQKDG